MTSAFSRSLVRSPTSTPKPRAEGRWSPVATVQRRPSRQARQVRPSISIMLWRNRLPLLYSVLSHPSSTSPIPSSTQNAPGFAFFGLFRVRFAHFGLF